MPDDRTHRHDQRAEHRPRLRRAPGRPSGRGPPGGADPSPGGGVRQLADTIRKVGPDPADLLSINIYDPRCGVGVLLIAAVRQLAGTYAGRTGQEIDAVLPQTVRTCVYGMEVDLLAVEMARFALYLETGGRVRPQELAGNIICGDPDAGNRPPAMPARFDAIDMVTGAPA